MKRIWFAIMFLLIAAGLCVGEQIYVKQVYNDLTMHITTAEKYADSNNTDELKNSVSDIKKYWDKNNELLFTFADHGVLDDLGTEIRSLDANEEEIKTALAEAKALTQVFYENQKITFANIF